MGFTGYKVGIALRAITQTITEGYTDDHRQYLCSSVLNLC